MQRSTFALFLLSTLVAPAFASGCGDTHVDPNIDASVADAATSADGSVCTTCEAITFDIEITQRFGLPSVPLTDGAVIPWVWGSQGGTMITPLIVFDPADVSMGTDVLVTIRHTPDPAAPGTFGEVSDFPELRQTIPAFMNIDRGASTVGALQDQLGWSALTGTRLTFEVEVSVAGFAPTTKRAVIELGDPTENVACAAFALDGGCGYRVIPGTATITAIETPMADEVSCVDGVAVTYEFIGTDPSFEDCLAALSARTPFTERLRLDTFGGANPPSSCLDGIGATMGGSLPATLRIAESGSCSPVQLDLDVDLLTCDEMCGL